MLLISQHIETVPPLEGRRSADWDNLAYHRYWMHNDPIRDAYAHYGVRDERYKLIYWYNAPLGQLGARANDAPPEWELFDCEADPFELVNQAGNPEYRMVFLDMLARLDAKMEEIGDVAEQDSEAIRAEHAV